MIHNEKFQNLKIEIKKAFKFIPAVLSYVCVSVGIGYFAVIYLGLPKIFFVSSLGIPAFPALLDYFARTSILSKLKEWWGSLPISVHIWLIIDCFAYYFLFKSYLHKETIWKNLLDKLRKN